MKWRDTCTQCSRLSGAVPEGTGSIAIGARSPSQLKGSTVSAQSLNRRQRAQTSGTCLRCALAPAACERRSSSPAHTCATRAQSCQRWRLPPMLCPHWGCARGSRVSAPEFELATLNTGVRAQDLHGEARAGRARGRARLSSRDKRTPSVEAAGRRVRAERHRKRRQQRVHGHALSTRGTHTARKTALGSLSERPARAAAAPGACSWQAVSACNGTPSLSAKFLKKHHQRKKMHALAMGHHCGRARARNAHACTSVARASSSSSSYYPQA